AVGAAPGGDHHRRGRLRLFRPGGETPGRGSGACRYPDGRLLLLRGTNAQPDRPPQRPALPPRRPGPGGGGPRRFTPPPTRFPRRPLNTNEDRSKRGSKRTWMTRIVTDRRGSEQSRSKTDKKRIKAEGIRRLSALIRFLSLPIICLSDPRKSA